MVGIDACGVVAAVSDDQVFAYRPVEQDVGESVRPYLLFIMGEVTVAEWPAFPSVVPAYVLWSHFHSGEKPCYIIQINGPCSVAHAHTLSVIGE